MVGKGKMCDDAEMRLEKEEIRVCKTKNNSLVEVLWLLMFRVVRVLRVRLSMKVLVLSLPVGHLMDKGGSCNLVVSRSRDVVRDNIVVGRGRSRVDMVLTGGLVVRSGVLLGLVHDSLVGVSRLITLMVAVSELVSLGMLALTVPVMGLLVSLTVIMRLRLSLVARVASLVS